MKVLIVDTIKGEITEEKEIASLTVVDGMWVKELNMIPLAYVYKAEHRDEVQRLLSTLNAKREELSQLQAEIFYKLLPPLRADQ